MKTSQLTLFSTLTSAVFMLFYSMFNITSAFLVYNRNPGAALSYVFVPFVLSIFLLAIARNISPYIFAKLNFLQVSELSRGNLFLILLHVFCGFLIVLAVTHIVYDSIWASGPAYVSADQHHFITAHYIQVGLGIVGFFLPKILR